MNFTAALQSFVTRLESESHTTQLTLEEQIDRFDPVSYLSFRELGTRFYWRDKELQNEILALGTAWTGEKPESVPAVFKSSRVYGGLKFSPVVAHGSPAPTPWSMFPERFFFIPTLEIHQTPSLSLLRVHVTEGQNQSLIDLIRSLLSFETISHHLPAVLKTSVNPERALWSSIFNKSIESIRQGNVQKIVLARQIHFDFDAKPDSVLSFIRLRESSPQCHAFFFSPDRGESFFGASPERLYQRNGTKIVVDAIAGTRKRSAHPTEDQALTLELRDSSKDLLEHRFVKDWICERLNQVCANVRVTSEEQVLKLPSVQHLYSQIEADILGSIQDSILLELLHPTPALAGYPVPRALQQISQLEPFDRGWYGGVIGYSDSDSADFTVCIRSARTQGNSVIAYSGVGLVSSSDATQEWNELDDKLFSMKEALGFSGRGFS